MRIAVISDIHGNRTAFEAVLADLREISPDKVLFGGDLADMGPSPAEIVDRIRDLGWLGVAGNGEEALVRPETLDDFANRSSAPQSMWNAVRECMSASRELLGRGRLDWLLSLPRVHFDDEIALVHASPDDPWRAPPPEASDAHFESLFGHLGAPVVIYGHIHRPFIREIAGRERTDFTVVNSGSVGLSYDGDPRAAYVVIEDDKPTIRRVQYDLAKEIRHLCSSGFPHSDWLARTLQSATPQMP
ncbi:MAG: metallophosphoesterase family protein [Acidobacteriaceae bacterium]|nr:metallophosphoesterase family protein [Acidobacteriaceae bacterium]